MKKITYFSTLVLSAMLMLTSCDGFLDAENKSSGGQTAADYFVTEEGLAAFRVYAYNNLKAIAKANTIQGDGTDLYVPSRGKAPSSFQNYTLNPEDGDVKSLYTNCFKLINNANGLLYYGGDKYKSEAMFLRAYGYYMLTQHFGSVPYCTEYINNASREYPKASLKTIYDNIISDLKTLAADASLLEITNDGTVNKRAVNALLAKVCLAAAWDLETTLTDEAKGAYQINGTTYATKALEAAKTAINGIALTQDFETKWAQTNENTNPETFFAVQYERAGYPGTEAEGGHGLQNDYGSYYDPITKTGLKQSSSVKIPSEKALLLFEKGDKRYEATYMTIMANYDKDKEWGKTGYYAYHNLSKVDFDKLPIAKYFAPYYVTQAEFEAFLTANKDRFAKGSCVNVPEAYLLQSSVLKYTFKADGTFVRPATSNAYNSSYFSTNNCVMPTVKKWDDNATLLQDNSSNCYRDIVILHASDIYLVAAEAAFLSEKESPLTYINAVRSRAGLTTPLNSVADYESRVEYSYTLAGPITMIDLILDERARELYAESQRWMDLRRTRQLVRYNVAYNYLIDNVSYMQSVATGATKWYRPIPVEELSSNTAMADSTSQNPGY